MTLAQSNFTAGAVLTWAIPLTVLLVVLVWWGAVLTVRALRARGEDG
ncbi:MAG TPA: hypothetical protein VMT59_09030 [Gaiellaceae bacterium]|nr:hypothetical protein [Gaiellaceae bacterium]